MRRLLTAILFVATSVVAAPVTAGPALAQDEAASVMRVAGTDRVGTAMAVARIGWDQAPRVLLATSRDYPDAVTAAAYSASIDAPLLLTDPSTLSAGILELLDDLGTARVTILGGPRAVTDQVADSLEAGGLEVDRIAGTSRWDTAARLADQVARRGPVEVVALGLGDRADDRDAWPDALAAASLAALDSPIPTLLTRQFVLPRETEDALARLRPNRVLLLGGTGAVGPEVEQRLVDLGYVVERLDGNSRYETAVAVARAAMDGPDDEHGSLDPRRAIFVSGEGFADALGAGALAARLDAPLLLTPGDGLADEVDTFVRAQDTSIDQAIVVGGPGVIHEFVTEELEAAMLGQPRPEPPPACDPEYSSPDCQYTYRHTVKTWEDLAECESHQNWQANTGNGYYGGLQFHVDTWRNVGGQGYPHENSKWEQIHRGEILQERSGWGQWPHCTRELGYR